MKDNLNHTGKIIGLDEPDKLQTKTVSPLEEKPRVSKTRKLMSWILFFVLLAILVWIVNWRLRAGFYQVKIVEKIEPESTAEQDSAFARRLRQRFERRRKPTFNQTEVLAAVNGINEDGRTIYNIWQGAHKFIPSHRMTKEIAQTSLVNLQTAFMLLDSAESILKTTYQKCEIINNASRQPGDKAYKLSHLYSMAKKLFSFIQEEANLHREYFNVIQAALTAVVARNLKEYDVKRNVMKYYQLKIDEHRKVLQSKIEDFNQAAGALFKGK